MFWHIAPVMKKRQRLKVTVFDAIEEMNFFAVDLL
jgi:hypothetical protein